MAKEVTAYVAKDGSIHLDQDAANLIDKAFEIQEDIDDFLKSIKAEDKDGCFRRLIIRWEQYRAGEPIPRQVAAPEVKATAVAPAVEAKPQPKAYKRKIGIVGVWSGNQASIKKDFSQSFDLNIYSPDEFNKLQGAKEFHKIFVMRKFVSHRHTDILRSIGQEPLLINGGMGELKEALLAYARTE